MLFFKDLFVFCYVNSCGLINIVVADTLLAFVASKRVFFPITVTVVFIIYFLN